MLTATVPFEHLSPEPMTDKCLLFASPSHMPRNAVNAAHRVAQSGACCYAGPRRRVPSATMRYVHSKLSLLQYYNPHSCQEDATWRAISFTLMHAACLAFLALNRSSLPCSGSTPSLAGSPRNPHHNGHRVARPIPHAQSSAPSATDWSAGQRRVSFRMPLSLPELVKRMVGGRRLQGTVDGGAFRGQAPSGLCVKGYAGTSRLLRFALHRWSKAQLKPVGLSRAVVAWVLHRPHRWACGRVMTGACTATGPSASCACGLALGRGLMLWC